MTDTHRERTDFFDVRYHLVPFVPDTGSSVEYVSLEFTEHVLIGGGGFTPEACLTVEQATKLRDALTAVLPEAANVPT